MGGVELDNGRFADAHFESRLSALIRRMSPATVICVDMPLGLMDSSERIADRLVSTMLEKRWASVFITPPGPVFLETDYAAACARSFELVGWKLSQQAWGLRTKLIEANALYDSNSLPLYEVHPELCFLNLGLRYDDGSKRSLRGQRARLRVLQAAGIEIPEDLGPAIEKIPADEIPDAAAAAWTAQRIATGQAQCVPEPKQINERGQPIAIWY
jgi:predicted RNase H-like nuclease